MRIRTWKVQNDETYTWFCFIEKKNLFEINNNNNN